MDDRRRLAFDLASKINSMLHDNALLGKAFQIYNDELLPLKDDQDFVLGAIEDAADISIACMKRLHISNCCSGVERRYEISNKMFSTRETHPAPPSKLEARVLAMENAIATLESRLEALEQRGLQPQKG